MKKYVVVDWQRDLVWAWLNSTDKGGFVQEVSEHDLYNNLGELDIVVIHEGPAFKKPPISTHVKAWFKHRINSIRSELGKDSVLYVIRGCKPEQNLLLCSDVRKMIETTKPDADELIRIGKRFSSRFVMSSDSIVADEGFFSDYLDEIFNYCAEKVKPFANLYTSEYLTRDKLKKLSTMFFASGEDCIYTGKYANAGDCPNKTVAAVDANEYFMGQLKANGLEHSRSDSSEAQLLEYGVRDYIEFIKKTM